MTAPDPSPALPDRSGGPSAVTQPNRPLAVIALIIGLLTLFTDQVASIARLSATRTELKAAHAAQEPQLEKARRIEAQLDALATGTAELAAQGNPNAAAIVASLQAQGVTINPQSKTRE